jgi:hypothetical protein
MKRWSVRLLLLSCALAACTAPTEAGQMFQRMKRERQQTPHRYDRAPMKQDYVFRDAEGKVKVRKVYPGYAEQFPTPAIFYYGYPHSGDDTGLGF